MERVTCPYCEVEISMDAVDREAGNCPECGALITGSLLFDDGESAEREEDDDEFEDDDR